MNKFKVGDRVMYTWDITEKRCGVVTKIHSNIYFYVQFDHLPEIGGLFFDNTGFTLLNRPNNKTKKYK